MLIDEGSNAADALEARGMKGQELVVEEDKAKCRRIPVPEEAEWQIADLDQRAPNQRHQGCV
jgi:hypothetical protein